MAVPSATEANIATRRGARGPAAGEFEQYLAAKHAARRTDWITCAVAASGAVVLLVLAGLLVGPLNRIRRDAQLVLDAKSLRGVPPDIALLTKTGTLRGIAIDVGFIRLENLKQENRFYELKQLSDWLCDLAPRYPAVWSYSAWNMAYNISVCQYTPEARWRWVSNGIENLRNKGIRYNPNSITLYKELAYIFWHKIGDKLDDFHWQYKKELAFQMECILGEPPLSATTDQTIDAFRRIAEAPKDLDALLANDAGLNLLMESLGGAGLKDPEAILEFVAQYLRTHSDVGAFVKAGQSEEGTTEQNAAPEPAASRKVVDVDAAVKLLRDPAHAAEVDRLLAALRSHVLRDDLNMDPQWMLELMAGKKYGYGPIDWRSPFAHSLYWGTYGDMRTKGSLNINPNDSMNAVRFIFFSLENMARMGRIVFEPDFDQPNRSFMQMLPDSRFIKYMHRAYLDFGREQFGKDERYVAGTAGPNYKSGHVNFLLEAIIQLYLEGGEENLEEAKDYFAYLYKFDKDEQGNDKPQYRQTLERFVQSQLYEKLDTQATANSFIAELLRRSLHDLSRGDVAASSAHFKEAKKWWNYYMRDVSTDTTKRRNLEPLLVIRRDVVRDFFAVPGYSNLQGYSLLQKHWVWQALDLPTRQAVYDEIMPYVARYCEEHDPPLDADKVLPVPPGMAEYREHPESVIQELQRLDPTLSFGEKMKPE